MCSWDKEKLLIPLEPHNKAQLTEIFLSFSQNIKRAVIFYHLANLTETAYLSVQDQELYNNVRLVEVQRG